MAISPIRWCPGHHDEERQALHRRIFTFIIGFLVLILLTIFIVFLILRPSKPSFILQDATVYEFNASSSLPVAAAASPDPSFLNSNIQTTVSSRNPNDRIGIYYDQLDAYASYRGQQVTLPVLLPESYQGHKEVIEWSPFLLGRSVPLPPYTGDALAQDLNEGMVLLNVKIDGRVKWKVGTWISGSYHLHVNYPALLMLKTSAAGPGLSMKVQLSQHCTVDV
ncbi:hypothetical protein SAY87_028626 [Trapa incisa]|uniref:Late embryogenesis abundant protein LEA-2 subgroup domain-containing protein n=1 Tax=Trapa incisa TaxID=236973 RepID=A0AAN7KUD2_9MYRT|nr:hypothetical protein SAY87_028626 [Trapa incisa]